MVINTPSCKPGNDANCACKAGIDSPLSIGGQNGFTDDLTGVAGVSCDLVVRPFQWKGVASSLRHFVRDALDFHFSMQAFEKVAYCDCDRDGKGNQKTGPEVTIGQVTAMASFVSMTRPPVQTPPSESAKLGEQIFLGKQPGLYQNMCANCHMGPMKLYTPFVLIEAPTNPNDEKAPTINPDNPLTWPISAASCPNGVPVNESVCPSESSYSATNIKTIISTKNHGSLITPTASSQQLPIVRRYKANLQNLQGENLLQNSVQAPEGESTLQKKLRAPFSANKTVSPAAEANAGIVGQDYVIPLNPPDSAVTDFQLPRLPVNSDNTVDVISRKDVSFAPDFQHTEPAPKAR